MADQEDWGRKYILTKKSLFLYKFNLWFFHIPRNEFKSSDNLIERYIMKVSCSNCRKSYNIPDEKLPMGKKVSFPCPNCKEKIKLDLRPQFSEDETVQIDQPFYAVSDAEKYAGGDELKMEMLQKLADLPAIPQVVFKAREIMADANSGIKDVVRVIETDQAITTKILKTANSVYYGMSGKVSTIQHALIVLGYKIIGEIITLASSSGLLDKTLKGYGLGSGDLWRHSISVGIGSRIIAKKKNSDLEETAFSTGLMHDAGKLVLDKYVLERKETFNEIMDHGRETFINAEQRIFGFNHAEIGFDVCRHWGIPEDIALSIRYHHLPLKSKKNELAYIVSLADTIVNMADSLATMGGMGTGVETMMYMIDDRIIKFLGIQEEEIKPIMDEIQESVKKLTQEIT